MVNIAALVRAVKRADLVITPELEPWLVKHGDEAFPDWVVDILADLLRTKPRIRSGSFSGSAAGHCNRRQQLQFAGVTGEAVDAQLQNIFNDGKFRHLRWQGMLLTLGLITDVEYLVKWPQMLSRGSLDGRGEVSQNHPNAKWRGTEFGFELKGVSTFQYSALAKSGPKDEHLRQIHHYFVLGGFDLFIVIYEDKTTQAWTEWVVEPDPVLLKEAEKQIWELRNSVKSKTLDAILPECVAKGARYKDCPFGQNGKCQLALTKVPMPFVTSY